MINKNIFQFPISYTSIIGQIAIGWGVHETVADECKKNKIKKALITTTGLKGTGIVEEILSILHYNGISTEVYNKVSSNPTDNQVMEAYKIFVDTQCDGIVSIGGGSSHDCGKGVRAVHANGGRYICDMAMFINPPWFEEKKKFKPVTLPQVTVNTTAGTGAESTSNAPIINTKVRSKQLIWLDGLGPNIALTDPLLVRCMPQTFASWTGFDALTHAFESYVCRLQTHYSKAMALHVVKTVSENLREFSFNRANHKACENMCWAASMGGVGLCYGGGVGIVHGIGHGISTLRGCHHGRASAVVTLPGERYNEPVCPERFAEMAAAMGVDTRGMTTMQASDKWFEEIEKLLKDLNIQTGNLGKQFGMTKEDVRHIVKYQYENDFAREGNPHDFIFDEVVALFDSML
jgi:alcohol dehydrogenase class IV